MKPTLITTTLSGSDKKNLQEHFLFSQINPNSSQDFFSCNQVLVKQQQNRICVGAVRDSGKYRHPVSFVNSPTISTKRKENPDVSIKLSATFLWNKIYDFSSTFSRNSFISHVPYNRSYIPIPEASTRNAKLLSHKPNVVTSPTTNNQSKPSKQQNMRRISKILPTFELIHAAQLSWTKPLFPKTAAFEKP